MSEERRPHPALKELKQGIAHLGDEFHSLSVYRLASLIIDVGGIIMGAVEDLQASVANVEAKVTAENEALGTIVDSLKTATTDIEQLQAQIAAGTPVTSDQLESFATRLTAVADAADAATTAAQTAAAPPTSGGVGPATGTPDPSAPAPGA